MLIGATIAAYVTEKVRGKIIATAEETVSSQSGKIFRSLADQFKENIPAGNEHLARAFLISYLTSTRQICERLNKGLGKDNLPSASSSVMEFVYGETPTGIFSTIDGNWIAEAKSHLEKKLGEIKQNRAYLPPESISRYQSFISFNDVSDETVVETFQNSFTEAAIADLRTALKREPPENFVSEMKRDWLRMLANEFVVSISSDDLINNIFQNRTLAELKYGNEIIKIEITDIKTFIGEDGEKTREKMDVLKTELMEGLKNTQNELFIRLSDPKISRSEPSPEELKRIEKERQLELDGAETNIRRVVEELINTIEGSMNIALKNNNEDLLSVFEGYLGLAYFTNGQYRKSIDKHHNAIGSVSEKQSHKRKSTNLSSKGNALLLNGELEDALDCYESSIKILKEKLDESNKK